MENKTKAREIVEEIVEMEGFSDDTKFIELFNAHFRISKPAGKKFQYCHQ